MSKNLSSKYYQKNKGKLKKRRSWKISKSFLRRKKRGQYGCECCKNLSEDEKQSLLNIQKILLNEKKCFVIIIRKYFD